MITTCFLLHTMQMPLEKLHLIFAQNLYENFPFSSRNHSVCLSLPSIIHVDEINSLNIDDTVKLDYAGTLVSPSDYGWLIASISFEEWKNDEFGQILSFRPQTDIFFPCETNSKIQYIHSNTIIPFVNFRKKNNRFFAKILSSFFSLFWRQPILLEQCGDV